MYNIIFLFLFISSSLFSNNESKFFSQFLNHFKGTLYSIKLEDFKNLERKNEKDFDYEHNYFLEESGKYGYELLTLYIYPKNFNEKNDVIFKLKHVDFKSFTKKISAIYKENDSDLNRAFAFNFFEKIKKIFFNQEISVVTKNVSERYKIFLNNLEEILASLNESKKRINANEKEQIFAGFGYDENELPQKRQKVN